ncbi:Hypothetical_protein [Hexamita inflata]|uniref:Hypothetical_protein n=1 Tax=Hexamita inflata TaxID=28002 RepID=A0AA86Q4V1_9EUKA|nr:Hypothetical protein HINF_LOCUS33429 [Hexamita inflata]
MQIIQIHQFQIIPHQREVRSKTGTLPGQLLPNHKQFNKKQKYVSLDTKCDLCNCKNDIYHELNCKKLQRNHILTHDYFVRQLADKMIDANKVREVKEVSKNNNNRTDQKHISINNQHIQIVIQYSPKNQSKIFNHFLSFDEC